MCWAAIRQFQKFFKNRIQKGRKDNRREFDHEIHEQHEKRKKIKEKRKNRTEGNEGREEKKNFRFNDLMIEELNIELKKY